MVRICILTLLNLTRPNLYLSTVCDRPGRYDLDVAPPPGGSWIKTNTLEGGHGWDYWLYEVNPRVAGYRATVHGRRQLTQRTPLVGHIQGWDGYDNEFVVGVERYVEGCS